MFKNRSVTEVMVLVFTFVVAFIIVASGITVAIVEIVNPQFNSEGVTQALLQLISGILGALLGLIAGKSGMASDVHQRPDEKQDGL